MASVDNFGKNSVNTDPSARNGTQATEDILDVVIVGGGFGGCHLLHDLREQGLRVKLIEAMNGFGGTWRGNRYPGARVDSEMPYYLLSAPEIMDTWTWTQRFPGHNELRSYFDHVDKVWDLSKDAFFNTRVTAATYDEGSKIWRVKTSDDSLQLSCRWFLPATGTSHKQLIPAWPGVSDFRGELYHPAGWPDKDSAASFRGKRVAVIGAGSSALQIVQEAAKHATHLTQFIRMPGTAVPMVQRDIAPEEVEAMRPDIPAKLRHVRGTAQGLPYDRSDKRTVELTPEEREAYWHKRWEEGSFSWTTAFPDTVVDKTASRLAYDFWARQIRARLPDPAKRDILAPLEPPYWIATKRFLLEQDYYEMVSLPHVDITNSPIKSLDAAGILTQDGRHRDFDLVVMATGYDAVTGTLKDMGISGRHSLRLADKWEDGVRTHLGMAVHGFPNMFFVYGPQAPTSLTTGPPFIEQQVEWICHVIAKATAAGWSSVEATEMAEEEWRQLTLSIADKTLLVETDSWYMGTNVPGKKKEMLLFLGGMPLYFEKCNGALDGMKGFECA